MTRSHGALKLGGLLNLLDGFDSRKIYKTGDFLSYLCIALCFATHDREWLVMIRRVLRRCLIAGAIVTGLVVVTVVIAGFLALRTPGFYAERLESPLSLAEQAAAKAHWQHVTQSYDQWLAHSVTMQRTDAANEYDPSQDRHVLRVTESHINALVASNKFPTRGAVQNPRFRINDDQTEVAFQLVSENVTCVVSAVLKPTLRTDGRLQLDILSARVGQLPIPLRTLIKCSPGEIKHTQGGMELDFTLPSPHITLKVFNRVGQSAKPKAVHCMDGELLVEFVAPSLPRSQTASRDTHQH